MLWCAGITGPFHPKPRRAVHRSLCWLCRRVCQGTAACQGCTGTSREAAQGAETSCWDLLLQSGRHRTVPLQSVTALLRQHSCLWLFLLMLLPTQAAAEPLHCHMCQKSPPWEGPSIGSSPMGRYLKAGAALLSSSRAQTTENHHSSTKTLTGVCKAEEPTPREQPVSTFSVPGDLILALVCSESCPANGSPKERFNKALASCFFSHLPNGANPRLEKHLSPATRRMAAVAASSWRCPGAAPTLGSGGSCFSSYLRFTLLQCLCNPLCCTRGAAGAVAAVSSLSSSSTPLSYSSPGAVNSS